MDETGGCGLMVSEMIAAEGLRRRNRRTMEMIAGFSTRVPQFIQLFGAIPKPWLRQRRSSPPKRPLPAST